MERPAHRQHQPRHEASRAPSIFTAHRSDGSGTTNIFTTYLSQVSPSWKANVGAGKSVHWPVGLGGKGNQGVAQLIKQNEGGIGYIELAYAVTNNISYAAVRNAKGKFIYPNVETTTLAASGVDPARRLPQGHHEHGAPGGYPITGFTFLLVYKNGTKPAMKKFLEWALTTGQNDAAAHAVCAAAGECPNPRPGRRCHHSVKL